MGTFGTYDIKPDAPNSRGISDSFGHISWDINIRPQIRETEAIHAALSEVSCSRGQSVVIETNLTLLTIISSNTNYPLNHYGCYFSRLDPGCCRVQVKSGNHRLLLHTEEYKPSTAYLQDKYKLRANAFADNQVTCWVGWMKEEVVWKWEKMTLFLVKAYGRFDNERKGG